MNYVIIGSALSGNKGAAAMLESSVQSISKLDRQAKFTLLSMYPNEDSVQNTYKNLQVVSAKPLELGLLINPLALLYKILPPLRPVIRKYSAAVRAIARADIFLDQGGITFTDGREKFLIYNVASILPALMIGVPVFKCAQALGPFNNRINRVVAKLVLPKVKHIVARGKITHQHLKSLGLKNVSLGADYAFSLEITKSEQRRAEDAVDIEFFKNGKTVGVSPSVVIHKKLTAQGKDYIGITAGFINWLISEGYKVALIPHSVRTGTDKTHNNDLPLCRDIYDLIDNKKQCLFVDKELGSQELRYIIGLSDYFIASRFHAMVSSLAMGVPTLVLGWSHKYKEVLDMFEMADFAYDYKDMSSNWFEMTFKKFIEEADGSETLEKFAKHAPHVVGVSNKQVNLIISEARSRHQAR